MKSFLECSWVYFGLFLGLQFATGGKSSASHRVLCDVKKISAVLDFYGNNLNDPEFKNLSQIDSITLEAKDILHIQGQNLTGGPRSIRFKAVPTETSMAPSTSCPDHKMIVYK